MTKLGHIIFGGLHSFWQSGLFSDVVVHTGRNQLPLHQVILSAHSPVFQAMFSTDMKEFAMKAVWIETPYPTALEQVLQFMYKGTVVVIVARFCYSIEGTLVFLSISDSYPVFHFTVNNYLIVILCLLINLCLPILSNLFCYCLVILKMPSCFGVAMRSLVYIVFWLDFYTVCAQSCNL